MPRCARVSGTAWRLTAEDFPPACLRGGGAAADRCAPEQQGPAATGQAGLSAQRLLYTVPTGVERDARALKMTAPRQRPAGHPCRDENVRRTRRARSERPGPRVTARRGRSAHCGACASVRRDDRFGSRDIPGTLRQPAPIRGVRDAEVAQRRPQPGKSDPQVRRRQRKGAAEAAPELVENAPMKASRSNGCCLPWRRDEQMTKWCSPVPYSAAIATAPSAAMKRAAAPPVRWVSRPPAMVASTARVPACTTVRSARRP